MRGDLSLEARHTRNIVVLAALLLLAALLMSLAAACGGGGSTKVEPEPDPDPVAGAGPGVVQARPEGAAQVDVSLMEWDVVPEPADAPAGEVYFLADNIGSEPHELVVIRTGVEPDQLPVVDGRVPEDDVDIIGEIEPFEAGTQGSVTLDLEPGSYVLICNVAEEEEGGELESHYEKGMRIAFTVQ